MCLLDEGDYTQGIKYIYDAYLLDPKFYKSLLKIGEVYLKLERYDEGIAYFDEILKNDPNNEFALVRKGDALLMKNNIQEAMNLYETVLKINENNEDALLGMGLCKHKMNNIDEAVEFYDKVLKIDDENSNAMYNKAVALSKKGEKKILNDLFKKLKKYDDSPYILYAYGLNNLKDKNYDLANENLDSCIQNNLKTPEVLHAKGQALYGNGEYEEALQYVTDAIKVKDNYYNAWNTMANIYDKMGNKDKALEWYAYANQIQPANLLYLINYCMALLDKGYNDKCKEYLAYVESTYQSQKEQFSEQEYDFIDKLAQNQYLDNFFQELATKEKKTVEQARMDYITKKTKISPKEEKDLMKSLKDHPQFKTLSAKEQKRKRTEID